MERSQRSKMVGWAVPTILNNYPQKLPHNGQTTLGYVPS